MTPPPPVPIGRLIVVTDRHQAADAGHDLADVVAAAVAGGARTILLREKDLVAEDRTSLAKALAELLAPVGGALLVAGDPALAVTAGAAGVHLAADQPPLARERLVVGRSCHTVDEVRVAPAEGSDYVTFSPVWATVSKPGYGPPVGLAALAEAASVPGVPVYALGGVEPGRAADCLHAGAAGVAVMGAIMRADDPAAVVRTLLAEMGRRPGEGDEEP